MIWDEIYYLTEIATVFLSFTYLDKKKAPSFLFTDSFWNTTARINIALDYAFKGYFCCKIPILWYGETSQLFQLKK